MTCDPRGLSGCTIQGQDCILIEGAAAPVCTDSATYILDRDIPCGPSAQNRCAPTSVCAKIATDAQSVTVGYAEDGNCVAICEINGIQCPTTGIGASNRRCVPITGNSTYGGCIL